MFGAEAVSNFLVRLAGKLLSNDKSPVESYFV